MSATEEAWAPDTTGYTQRQKTFLGVQIALTVVADLVVILRFVTRRVTNQKLWWDDLLIVLALVRLSWTTLITEIMSIAYLFDRHLHMLSVSFRASVSFIPLPVEYGRPGAL